MTHISLTARIKTFVDGRLAGEHTESLDQYLEAGAPVDAAVQDLGMRLARVVRTQETARRDGIRQPPGDHSRIDEP